MKFLYLWGSIACMLLCAKANCQSAPLNQHPVEKPLLFSQLPEKIACSSASLQNIFTAALNSPMSFALGNQLKIEGTVIAKTAVTPGQLSMNIRCSNFQNALLNISRITQTDGSYFYTGRIVNLQYGDILLLWEENGQYAFIRQKQLLSMVE